MPGRLAQKEGSKAGRSRTQRVDRRRLERVPVGAGLSLARPRGRARWAVVGTAPGACRPSRVVGGHRCPSAWLGARGRRLGQTLVCRRG